MHFSDINCCYCCCYYCSWMRIRASRHHYISAVISRRTTDPILLGVGRQLPKTVVDRYAGIGSRPRDGIAVGPALNLSASSSACVPASWRVNDYILAPRGARPLWNLDCEPNAIFLHSLRYNTQLGQLLKTKLMRGIMLEPMDMDWIGQSLRRD